jgi:hypothetical protein
MPKLARLPRLGELLAQNACLHLQPFGKALTHSSRTGSPYAKKRVVHAGRNKLGQDQEPVRREWFEERRAGCAIVNENKTAATLSPRIAADSIGSAGKPF